MRRIACLLLCLALCCALFACKKTAPDPPGPTTTEAPISEVPAPEENGVTWRILDLDDESNSENKKWIKDWEEERNRPRETDEFPMGAGKTLIATESRIALRDDASGKRTTLLERRYHGDSDDPVQDEVAWTYPDFGKVIDERYFVVTWYGWEYVAGISVYDTKELREIPIQWDAKDGSPYSFRFYDILDKGLYLVDTEYGPYFGQLHLMRADLTQLGALKPGEPLKAVDLLAGIPHAPAEEVSAYELTKNGRWFIVADRNGLYLFDLQANALTALPKTGFGVEMREDWEHVYFSCIAMRDEHTLYLYGQIDNENFASYMAEITLP